LFRCGCESHSCALHIGEALTNMHSRYIKFLCCIFTSVCGPSREKKGKPDTVLTLASLCKIFCAVSMVEVVRW
jgi:hypothetical protein